MPSTGYTGCLWLTLYVRKHAPWVNLTNVPASDSIVYSGTNKVPTVLVGPMITPATKSSQNVTHYTVLHTIETIFGLACMKNEWNAGGRTVIGQ